MIEPIETDDWRQVEIDLPPDVVQAIQAAAAYHGRTFSEQIAYDLWVRRGLLRPSLTH